MIADNITENAQGNAPSTVRQKRCHAVEGWREIGRNRFQKAFRFNTSAHVLAFALKARQLAREADIIAKVDETFGQAEVILFLDNRRHDLCADFAGLLNRTAAMIRSRSTSPLRTTFR